jgi:hypothetical protein
MTPFPSGATISLVALIIAAIAAYSADRFPAHRRAFELCAGLLLFAGLSLLGALLAPLLAIK